MNRRGFEVWRASDRDDTAEEITADRASAAAILLAERIYTSERFAEIRIKVRDNKGEVRTFDVVPEHVVEMFARMVTS